MRMRSVAVDGFEEVLRADDLPGGRVGFIAIHSTALGPGLGGLRLWRYASEEEALRDVARLAEAMTWKAAAAGLPLGGGKAVVVADPGREKTPELLDAVGDFVEAARGRYITAEDVGIGAEDLVRIRARTRHVTGLPRSAGGSGDPSPYTARGVLRGMEVSLEIAAGSPEVRGRTVAIQGVGHVGGELARFLAERGARLFISDVDAERAERCARETGAEVVSPEAIARVPCDVFAPCALGGAIDSATALTLPAKIVAGAANNQLDSVEAGDALAGRGILYAPDFVVNAGGLINISVELEPGGYREERALELVDGIADTLREVFALAKEERVSPARAALRLARARVESGG